MINAVITGIGGYVPEDKITNEDLEKIVDTTDEWIMTRVGVKERRILKNGKALSFMAVQAVNELIEKTGIDPASVEGLLCATTTGDYVFPPVSSIIASQTSCRNAFTFDLQAACSGFVFLLETAANYIRSGRYKRIIVVAGDMMTSMTNYSDRTTCPLFGDGCGAVLLEPTTEPAGVIDAILRSDGTGRPHLYMKAGGSLRRPSHETIDNNEHSIYQEGQAVFKRAVSEMTDVTAEIVERNGLSISGIDWFVPHQANMRIVDAAAQRLEVPMEKVMINIERYGNTSAGSIPLCLWEWESKLKKGDNLVLASFGAGFIWGAIYMKWGYDSITNYELRITGG